MKAYVCPARYAPELTAAISSAMRRIEFSMKDRALGGKIDYVDTDDSLTGSLVVLVADAQSTPHTTATENAAA